MTAIQRFLSKVKRTRTCWLWQAGKTSGYGRFWFNGKLVNAHRWSYEHFRGKLRKGLLVLHKCDVPACVNPKHLFAGTQKQNIADMIRKGRDLVARPRSSEARSKISAGRKRYWQQHTVTPEEHLRRSEGAKRLMRRLYAH